MSLLKRNAEEQSVHQLCMKKSVDLSPIDDGEPFGTNNLILREQENEDFLSSS